ncbi:MAG: HepT-like ribonuclease domain-containing protein [Candidatus Moraniibacteriota bacterium]
MLNKELIKFKLGAIVGYLGEIESIKNMDIFDILGDVKNLRFFERNFQLIVDTMLDINSHIIVEESFGIPDTYSNTFIILGEKEVLPFDFAYKIAEAVKLRNMVVHKYDKVDNKKMIQDLKNGISQFEEYLVYIDNFIKPK